MVKTERGRDGLRRLDRTIGIPTVAALSIIKTKRQIPTEVGAIGLVALGAIGDTIISVGSAIPVLRQAFPQAKLSLFTSKSNSSIAPLLPPCDELRIISVTDPIHSVSLLRSLKQDILIDFGPWPRISAILVALSKARFTVGFKTPGQHRHYAYDLAVEHSGKIHEFENHANLLASIGVARPAWPRITPSMAALKRINEEHPRPYIVCHPWASGFRSEMREWPNGHWQRFAAIVAQNDWDVVFTGGPTDVARSEMLVAGITPNDNKVHDTAGRYSLNETAALLEGSACVVSVNTGVMHLAAAINTPIVALHGPTDPVRWGPLSDNARLLLPNSPDTAYLNLGFEYPDHAKSCMHMIEVDEVISALFNQLELARAN